MPIGLSRVGVTNNFDEAKPMSSSEFTKTISVSNSTATTTGWKIGTGTKVSGEISIGVGKIGAEVSVTTEYNSSTTDQVTKTTTDTYPRLLRRLRFLLIQVHV